MKHGYRKAKLTVATTCFLFSAVSFALPANFTGTYQILQKRSLALTNGRGFVLQEGELVADSAVDLSRTYCRANQSTFDDDSGDIEVVFETAIDGTEHALLKTIPALPSSNPTTLECTATNGFSGSLDISIALGRVLELTK